MKKLSPKTKFRVALLTICVIICFVICGYTVFSTMSELIGNISETKNLNREYTAKLDEEEKLKDEINKLKDPEYLARYTREKYLYSAADEIIIKIDDNEE